MPTFIKKWWFLLLAGAFGALAMPPFYIVPALVLPFATLFLVLQDSKRRRTAFIRAFLIGFGYHLAGLYWIANAMLVPGSPFLWAYPLALIGLPLLFALYFGVLGLLYHKLRQKWPMQLWQSYLLLALLLAVMEYVRGFLFTGFPWNLPAYTWLGILPVAQSLALIGPHALTILTLLLALLPALFILRDRHATQAAATLAMIFALLFAGGVWRLSAPVTNTNTMVHIVQPNIPQAEKWDAEKYADHLQTLLYLSAAPKQIDQRYSHVILWPETAVNGRMLAAPDALDQMRAMLTGYGSRTILLAGALRSETAENGEARYYNSMVAWGADMQVVDIFDKAHLVPFGEYMPLDKYIPLGPIVGFSGFAAGPGPRTLRLAPTIPPVSPLVCYEVIFPGYVTDPHDRPAWLANSTNDSWYGRSTGPYQHLAITQARAIEEGLPIARAANTGISALIDPYGRMISAQPLNTAATLRAPLPPPLPATPYSQHKNLFFFTMLVVMYVFIRKRYDKKVMNA